MLILFVFLLIPTVWGTVYYFDNFDNDSKTASPAFWNCTTNSNIQIVNSSFGNFTGRCWLNLTSNPIGDTEWFYMERISPDNCANNGMIHKFYDVAQGDYTDGGIDAFVMFTQNTWGYTFGGFNSVLNCDTTRSYNFSYQFFNQNDTFRWFENQTLLTDGLGNATGDITGLNTPLFQEAIGKPFLIDYMCFADTELECRSALGLSPIAPPGVNISVELYTPNDNNISNLFTRQVTHKFTPTTTGTAITNCSLWTNESGSFTLEGVTVGGISNATNNTFLFASGRTDIEGTVIWNVQCCLLGECATALSNFSMTIDTTNPTIIGKQLLEDNRTILTNNTLITFINFSDNREIYSINVTMDDGLILFNGTNMAVLNYTVRIDTNISNISSSQALTARVCDSHTSLGIEEVKDVKLQSSGVKYVMKKTFLGLIDSEWIKVTPKYEVDYNKASTTKLSDRYSYTMNKKTGFGAGETFTIESSHFIDIINSKEFGGHLVIPGIDGGWWIDLETGQEGISYMTKRISPTMVEVSVYGLQGSSIQFRSVGELNCISRTFRVGLLNPIESFVSETTINTLNDFTLRITVDDLTMGSLNATLHYNNTDFFAGSTSNFTLNITSPLSVSGNETNITWYWFLQVPGQEINLSLHNQTVKDFNLDACTSNTVLSLNFSFFNETGSNNVIDADYTATFNYTLGGIEKQTVLTGVDVTNFSVCMFPNGVAFTGSWSILFSQTGHAQREFVKEIVTYSNVTQNFNMFLLGDSVAVAFAFRLFDSFQAVLSDVLVLMERTLLGSTSVIESRSTDDAGLAQLTGNSDVTYSFTFSKAGFPTLTSSLRPVSGLITDIILGSIATQDNRSFSDGIITSIGPGSPLQNDTLTRFSINLSSSFWQITTCTMSLRNASDTLLSTTPSFNITDCIANLTFYTGNHTSLVASMSYVLNSTSPTLNAFRNFVVVHSSEGRFSLKSWLDDVKAFSKAGFDSTTRMLFALVIITVVITLAATDVRFLRTPTNVILLVIGLVWAFSFMDWFNLTFKFLPDVMNQYGILVMVGLLGFGFILKSEVPS